MEQKFNLPHFALYAKGWYKMSDDIWEDMKKIFSASDYNGQHMSKSDMISVLLRHCNRLKLRAFDLDVILMELNSNNTWKYGYYTKDSPAFIIGNDNELKEYDYFLAILYYCKSQIMRCERTQIPLCKPDYKNCLPKSKNVTKAKIKEIFG